MFNQDAEYRSRFLIQGDYYEELRRRRAKFKFSTSPTDDVPISRKVECTDNPRRNDSPAVRFRRH